MKKSELRTVRPINLLGQDLPADALLAKVETDHDLRQLVYMLIGGTAKRVDVGAPEPLQSTPEPPDTAASKNLTHRKGHQRSAARDD